MEEPAWLAVWLLGLFSLIGFVMAAVAKLVRNDTTEHDERYVWRTSSKRNRADGDGR